MAGAPAIIPPPASLERTFQARWKAIEAAADMATYFFNVIAGSVTIKDAEGTDLPSLEVAKDEACEDARALMSQAVLLGRDISGRTINICDELGEVLASVPFRTALTPFE